MTVNIVPKATDTRLNRQAYLLYKWAQKKFLQHLHIKKKYLYLNLIIYTVFCFYFANLMFLFHF